jgi:hypothetical protein
VAKSSTTLDDSVLDALRELHAEVGAVALDDEILRDLKVLPRLLAKLADEPHIPDDDDAAIVAAPRRARRPRKPRVSAPPGQ